MLNHNIMSVAEQKYREDLALYEQELAAYKEATAPPFLQTVQGKITMVIVLLVVLFLSWSWLKTTALGKILTKLVDFISDIVTKL
jgi:hypothetical protein